jgi:hypothetical protein
LEKTPSALYTLRTSRKGIWKNGDGRSILKQSQLQEYKITYSPPPSQLLFTPFNLIPRHEMLSLVFRLLIF